MRLLCCVCLCVIVWNGRVRVCVCVCVLVKQEAQQEEWEIEVEKAAGSPSAGHLGNAVASRLFYSGSVLAPGEQVCERGCVWEVGRGRE